jgi:TonB-dependent Receptor Plug Domain
MGAQSTTTRVDSARSDRRTVTDTTKSAAADSAKVASASKVSGDSVPKKPPKDTIKTPIARAYTPRSTEIAANGWHWDRDAMFASGAQTLAELLANVPGVTLMTTGFILAPQVIAYYGDPGRVRIFLDGIEMDVLNPRNGGIQDFAMIPFWSLEDVQVERAAGELRVHLRLWRVDRTTANTRTDVITGTENLNLYRGFFGKRFDNGAVIQLAGQQQSTIDIGGMDGDALGGMARVGWARGDWSVDGTWLHQGIDRNAGDRYIDTSPQLSAIPPYFGSEGLAYFRVAWRDPDADGPWAQFIAATLTEAKGDTNSSLASGLAGVSSTDSTDTTTSRSEYVLAAGLTRWGIRLSSTNRIRSISQKSYFSPGVRAEYSSRLLTVSAFGEHALDSTTHADVSGRLAPFPWLNIGASASELIPKYSSQGPSVTNTRIEVGLEWHDRWVTGGLVTRSSSLVAAPIELDTSMRAVLVPAANGEIVSFRGPLLLGVHFDFDAINWSSTGPYRPQTQARAKLWFESSFLHRFPRNNFHVYASGTFDYFSTMYVPLGTNATGQSSDGAGIISTLLEIKISSAVIFWQYRNAAGAIYSTFPGYVMPRLVNLYGMRWQFWN